MGTTYQLIIIILGYIIATIVGAYFIRLILSRYEKETGDSGLKKAGMVIGIIERFLVITFVLLKLTCNNNYFCCQIYCKI